MVNNNQCIWLLDVGGIMQKMHNHFALFSSCCPCDGLHLCRYWRAVHADGGPDGEIHFRGERVFCSFCSCLQWHSAQGSDCVCARTQVRPCCRTADGENSTFNYSWLSLSYIISNINILEGALMHGLYHHVQLSVDTMSSHNVFNVLRAIFQSLWFT